LITCTTILKPRADSEEPFERLLKSLVRNVRENEPDTTLFELVRSQNAPRTYLVIEQYRDKDALAFHSGTDYLKTTVPEMMTYLEEEPKLDSFDPVE
jgi:quinol monooxygenase YgiN